MAAVFAHPDDESRICGGTLALHALRGWTVALYCATRGEAGDVSMAPADVAALRERELEAACRTLGISQLHLGRLPDGGMPEVDPGPVIDDVVRFLRLVRPEVVVTFGPDGRDGHPDHVTIGRIAAEAFALCRSAGHRGNHAGLGLEPWTPRRLYEVAMPDSAGARGWPHPTLPDEQLVRVDVSEVSDLKRRAVVDNHASQFALSPWNLSPEAWKAREAEYFRLAHTTGPDWSAPDPGLL